MICISIGNIELLKRAIELRPELVEIRYDLLNESPSEIGKIVTKTIGQVATCRPGKYSDAERLAILKGAIDHGAAYVDVELESEDEFVAELIAYANKTGCEPIVSYHNFEFTPGPDELKSLLDACFQKGGQIAKMACMVKEKGDLTHLLSLYEKPGRKIIIGMGEQGRLTRYAALEMGAEFTFASISNEGATAPGQMTYEDIQSINKILKNK